MIISVNYYECNKKLRIETPEVLKIGKIFTYEEKHYKVLTIETKSTSDLTLINVYVRTSFL